MNIPVEQLVLLGAITALPLLGAEIWFLFRGLQEHGRLLVRIEALERSRARQGRPEDARPPIRSVRGAEGTLPTLVAASVSTIRRDLLLKRWAAEDRNPYGPAHRWNRIVLHAPKENYRLLADGELGPAFLDHGSEAGLFLIYDWSRRELVWQRSWGAMLLAPFGYCFADGFLYLVDQWGCGIFQIDVSEEPGRLLKRISHPYLNDVHSVVRTRRGLLTTSAGTDLILEVDLDGNLLYEWWATEHGYAKTLSGHERRPGRDREHRDLLYHTQYHTTHLNEATFRDPDERYLLAILFHQGQVVQIDRNLPSAEQKPQVLLDGLHKPHGLRRIPSGWLICSSTSYEVLLLDDALRIVDQISYQSGWIHDCTMLVSGDLLLNDGQHCQLVQFSGPPWRIVSVVPYPRNWRLFRLEEVPPDYQEGFRRAVAANAAEAAVTRA